MPFSLHHLLFFLPILLPLLYLQPAEQPIFFFGTKRRWRARHARLVKTHSRPPRSPRAYLHSPKERVLQATLYPECFKACITISFKYALLTKREVVNMTAYYYYMDKLFFCILLDFLKFLNIFSGWLCHETSSFARCATSCIEARFAQF